MASSNSAPDGTQYHDHSEHTEVSEYEEYRRNELQKLVNSNFEVTDAGVVLFGCITVSTEVFPDEIVRRLLLFEHKHHTFLLPEAHPEDLALAVDNVLTLPFYSTGNERAQNDFVQDRETTMSGTQSDLLALRDAMKEQWPDIPKSAGEYLLEHCKSRNHLEQAIIATRELLATHPHSLNDPDVVEIILSDIIKEFDTATVDQQVANVRTKIDGIKHEIAGAAKGKRGFEQIKFAQAYLEEMNLDGAVKAELQTYFARIEQTFRRVSNIATTPEEQDEISRLIVNTKFDLAGGDMSAVFSGFILQTETSHVLSEASKDNIAKLMGIPRSHRPKTGGELLATLGTIKSNDGRFINNAGKVVEFNEHNGVSIGNFTVYRHPNDADEYIAKAQVGGRDLRLPFPPNANADFLTRQLRTAMIGFALANKDFQGAAQDVLGGNYSAAQGITEIKLASETEVQRADHVFEAFLGTGTLYHGRIPSQHEIRVLDWRLQSTHIDGDGKTNNTGRGDLSWQRLGMLSGNGKIDYEQLDSIGTFIRRSLSLPNFDSLESKFGSVA